MDIFHPRYELVGDEEGSLKREFPIAVVEQILKRWELGAGWELAPYQQHRKLSRPFTGIRVAADQRCGGKPLAPRLEPAAIQAANQISS